MNITSGNPVQKGASLSEINPKDYMAKLMEEKFNGYMCVTIKGKTGIEEGALIFHNGNIVSSDYEYYRYNKRFVAEEGLKRMLNSLVASKGVVDSFSLSPYQVQLVMTLNEDCNLRNEVMSVSSIDFPNAFSPAFEDSLSGEKVEGKGYEKELLLKKYGLAKLSGPKLTRAILLESAEEEYKKVDKMIKKKEKK